MDDDAKKIIKERFEALPKEIQEIILSSNYQNTLVEIGKKHNLMVSQMGVLELETTMVMMGLTPVGNFETELTHELEVDRMKGAQIVKDINEGVFFKIRELLKLMSGQIVEKNTASESDIKPVAAEAERDILNSAGINIAPNGGVSGGADPDEIENREELLKKIEKPVAYESKYDAPKEEAPSILAQKLSGSFQTPVKKTEHTLENITKSRPESTAPAPQIQTPKPYPKNMDPYRLNPDS